MLIVKKFGGTSVGDKERIFNVARRCAEEYRKGNDIIVVLSAMGKSTDELIALAQTINPNPPKRELDMLLTTGEQVSASLMAMAFDTNTERLMAGHREILEAIRSRDYHEGMRWANRFLRYLPNSLIGRFMDES